MKKILYFFSLLVLLVPLLIQATYTPTYTNGFVQDIFNVDAMAMSKDLVVSSTPASLIGDNLNVGLVKYEVTAPLSQTLAPASSTVYLPDNFVQCHSDNLGNAYTYNITIDPNDNETINGQATYTIDENWGSVCLRADSDTNWRVVYDSQTDYPTLSGYNLLSDLTPSVFRTNESYIVPAAASTTAYYLGHANYLLDQSEVDLPNLGYGGNAYGYLYGYAKQKPTSTYEAWLMVFTDQSTTGTVTNLNMLNIGSEQTASVVTNFTALNLYNNPYGFNPTSTYFANFTNTYLTNNMINVRNDSDKWWIPMSSATSSITFFDTSARTASMMTVQAGSASTPMNTPYTAGASFSQFSSNIGLGLIGSQTSAGLDTSEFANGVSGLIATHASDNADANLNSFQALGNFAAGNTAMTTAYGAAMIGGVGNFDYLINTQYASDIRAYKAVNDGSPVWRFGSADAESLGIQTVYDTGAQTLNYVNFNTYTASSTADKGQYIFNVDETEVLSIDDAGLVNKYDVYITTSTKGIVLTSPDGTCARGTIDNSDVLTFSSITCP